MSELVTSADANRRFSQILRGVREGKSYVVTSHGKPVAQIVPASIAAAAIAAAEIAPARIGANPLVPREVSVNGPRRAAREFLLGRLRKQSATNIGAWSREELYAR